MAKDNIILIGMPGAGKSTLGVLLAKFLGKAFIDTDLLIQEKSGALLQQILDKDGLSAFLELEEQVIMELDTRNSVIATGGSAIYSAKAMESLKKRGFIFFLDLKYEDIEARLGDYNSRGIAARENQTLRDIYIERCPLYKTHADFSVSCSDKSMVDTVREIEAVYCKEKNCFK